MASAHQLSATSNRKSWLCIAVDRTPDSQGGTEFSVNSLIQKLQARLLELITGPQVYGHITSECAYSEKRTQLPIGAGNEDRVRPGSNETRSQRTALRCRFEASDQLGNNGCFESAVGLQLPIPPLRRRLVRRFAVAAESGADDNACEPVR